MKKDTYEKAKRLITDIEKIDAQLKEKEKDHHWITTSTPYRKDDGACSMEFQDDLVKFLKDVRDRYQREFDEL